MKTKILRGAALCSHVHKLLEVEPPGSPLAVALKEALAQGFLEVVGTLPEGPAGKCPSCGMTLEPAGVVCPNCD